MNTPLIRKEAKPAAPRLALRPREAALALGISERTLWTMTQDADCHIPHIRVGRCVVYPVDGLRKWLAERARIDA
jgi:predicted DNA-binding transcriptional regulator AlpA